MPGVARIDDEITCDAKINSGSENTFCNTRRVARVGDTIDHGGVIVQGSPNVFCNGRPVARKDDLVICDIHDEQKIRTASENVFANGM